MRLSPLRVLIVDDIRPMRVLLGEILRAAGVRQLVEAGDAESAYDVLLKNEIDLVVTDLLMRPTTGIELVRRIRTAEDSPHPMIPVIMVTGHSTEQRVREARDAGVTEFLTKPVTARGLLERLGEVVENPRPFVQAGDFFGPDRRRKADPDYAGPRRRASDAAKGGGDRAGEQGQ